SFNLVSSPGSGKTSLLERTLEVLGEELGIAVMTGDVQTQNDADRLARRTERLVQAVVTGGACHLDAAQVTAALEAIDLERTRLLFIENVGNLVCPASWDLGETAKIVVLSVTEGEDKPLKYPKMFRMARYAVLNKIDLLPHLDFDLDLAVRYAREINPELRFFFTSARSGEGLDEWFQFLRAEARAPAHR
nr:hydrogenase nickel incorporation protein HypB [Gemmatimonadales bacterium]